MPIELFAMERMQSTWENLVACCLSCNNRKGSRTPEDAGMKLARTPRPFVSRSLRRSMASPSLRSAARRPTSSGKSPTGARSSRISP